MLKRKQTPSKDIWLYLPQAAQAHFMNAGVTLACELCCVTNGYLQRFVWDANGFS